MTRKTVNNANPGTADIVGGDDWDSLIADLARNPWPYSVAVSKVGGTIYAMTAAGEVITSGTAGTGDDTVIQTAIDNVPNNGILLIMPGNYTVGANVSALDFDTVDMVTVMAYGVTITAHSTSRSQFMFRPDGPKTATPTAPKRSYAIYGMTVDLQDNWGAAFGTNVGTEAKLIKLIDVTIKNIHSYGVLTGNNNSTVNEESELYCENIKVDAGGIIADNECIAARCNGRVTIRNAVLAGNKALHLSSRNITLYNVSCDGTAYTGLSEMSPINGEFTDCRNIYMKDLALSFRPFLSMDGQTAFGNCKQCTVSGYVHVEAASVMNGIQIGGYEDTTTASSAQIENCTIENFNFSRAGIFLQPHAQASSGTVKNLTIRNGYMNSTSGNNRILVDNNININLLTIENVQIGTYSTATEAPIYILTNIAAGRDSNVTIGRCKIENITPESTANIIRASDNGSAVAKTVTVTFERPLGNNVQGSTTSGAVTLVMKFRKNQGKYITNGNASTTVFNIPHSLISSPLTNSIRVNAGHADSRGSFDVSADATNVIVTYGSAPPTGTNNVVLYWSAESA